MSSKDKADFQRSSKDSQMASKDEADFQRSSKDSHMASKDNADFQRSSKDSHLQEVLQDEGASALPAPRPHLSTASITPPRVTSICFTRLKRSQKFQDGSKASEGACGLPSHTLVPSTHNNTKAPPVARKRWTILPMDSLEVTKRRFQLKRTKGQDGRYSIQQVEEEKVGEEEPVNDIQKSKML